MEFDGIVFEGPPYNDEERGDPMLLRELPGELARLLKERNGFIAFAGGLHVRGACNEPSWHSLREVWKGAGALHERYPEVKPTDVPFAQDCVGDQYLLRDGEVVQLFAEMGEVEHLDMSLTEFFQAAIEDPAEMLCTDPLELFLQSSPRLVPGRLLQVYPPFCCDADERELRDMPAEDLLDYHTELSNRLSELPEGAEFDYGSIPQSDRPTPTSFD
ncbi:MAG: hypothetical protein AB7K71_04485 [Polyangiaceae bacterium]